LDGLYSSRPPTPKCHVTAGCSRRIVLPAAWTAFVILRRSTPIAPIKELPPESRGDVSPQDRIPMSPSLKEKIRYRLQYPLRYKTDLLRAAFLGNKSPTRRVLIASDNRTPTSEEQFTPLLANRQRVFSELGVVLAQRLIDEVLASGTRGSAYDVILAKVSFNIPPAEAVDKIARLRRQFPHPCRIIYFDGDDDCCVQFAGILEHVDLYVKKHVFADMSWYGRQFAGKNNLTDYVTRLHGASFADNIIPHSGVVPESLLHKIVLGYNIGMDAKITDLFNATRPAPPSEKTIDVMCRAACKPDLWIYPFRGPIEAALEPLKQKGRNLLVPNQRVDQQGYYQEMRGSKVCISPFGYGELCWRDFEAVLMGCLLVKPSMEHIRTKPNIFIAGETYVPVKWDFSDLAEVCEKYLADDESRNRITVRAYEVLSQYYSNFAWLSRFGEILELAGAASTERLSGEAVPQVRDQA